MKKISIIIPVYNNEATLEKAVESVLSQDFQDFELIIIDDGSCDSSLEICQRAKASDERVRVIHTENKGVASARNTALFAAEGKYIMFLDGDDFYFPGAVSHMVSEIENNCCDIVSAGLVLINKDGKERRLSSSFSGIYQRESMPSVYKEVCRGEDSCLISFVDKIYSVAFLREHCITFPMLNSGEDSVFALEALLCAEKVLFIDEFPFYGYVTNPDSFTKKKMSVEERISFSDSFFKSMSELLEKYGMAHLETFLAQRKALAIYDFVMCVVSDDTLSKKEKRDELKYIAQRDSYISVLSKKEIRGYEKRVCAIVYLMKNKHINTAFFLANIIKLAKAIFR